ncbi:MAG TPA: MerC domain-containing protein [Rudaea sp.]|nr:MerC domain-containing protein [Rudaea sp.]
MQTQSFPHDPRSADEGATLVQVADRVGATASFLCALHCAALPFVLALLPALGLSFLADHSFERWFIAFATALALTMMIRGYRRHGSPQALYLLFPGLVLLWLGGYVFDLESFGLWHAALVSLGGTAVALAHIVNLRLTNLHRFCCADGRRAIV